MSAVGMYRGDERHENGQFVTHSLCDSCLRARGDIFAKVRRIGDGAYCDRCGKSAVGIALAAAAAAKAKGPRQ